MFLLSLLTVINRHVLGQPDDGDVVEEERWVVILVHQRLCRVDGQGLGLGVTPVVHANLKKKLMQGQALPKLGNIHKTIDVPGGG